MNKEQEQMTYKISLCIGILFYFISWKFPMFMMLKLGFNPLAMISLFGFVVALVFYVGYAQSHSKTTEQSS